jgi:hypothetical protein
MVGYWWARTKHRVTAYFRNPLFLFGAPAAIRTRGLRIRNPFF